MLHCCFDCLRALIPVDPNGDKFNATTVQQRASKPSRIVRWGAFMGCFSWMKSLVYEVPKLPFMLLTKSRWIRKGTYQTLTQFRLQMIPAYVTQVDSRHQCTSNRRAVRV